MIELLAVIIILGVLMLIAVPSVTEYINKSRKSAFITSVSNILDNAKRPVVANSFIEGKKFTILDNSFIGDGFEVQGKLPQSGTIMDYYKNELNDAANPECPSDVVIPVQINGVTVRAIGPGAFITIEKSQRCSVYNPWGYDTVELYYVHEEGDGYDECAFLINWSYIGRLTSVIIPNTVTKIYYDAFKNNQLSNLVMGSSVTDVGFMSFYSNLLTSLTLPDSIINIGPWAFQDNQISSVNIPNDVTIIDDEAFSVNQIASIDIPNSVTKIGAWAFNNNDLTTLTIPNSITTIDMGAFENNQLESVNISNNVTVIKEYAFYRNKLESLTIPNSVTTIEEDAFGLNPLTNVTIGNGITNIHELAFNECASLMDIYIERPRSYVSNMSGYSTKWGAGNATIACQGDVLYQITSDSSSINLPLPKVAGAKVILESNIANKLVTSFKLNGVLVNGYNFIMPTGNAHITEVTLTDYYTLESNHPYSNYFDYTWTQTIPGANSVSAIFDVRTSTEKNYDYIYIYDKNNVQIGIYSHTNLSNKEIVVPGDTIKVRLTTDGATIDWGFKCRVYKKN